MIFLLFCIPSFAAGNVATSFTRKLPCTISLFKRKIKTKTKRTSSVSTHSFLCRIHQTKCLSTSIPAKTFIAVVIGDDVKSLARFYCFHNNICVLEVSKRATNNPFTVSHLLPLDSSGNIHFPSFLLKTLTNIYFDVFVTLMSILTIRVVKAGS